MRRTISSDHFLSAKAVVCLAALGLLLGASIPWLAAQEEPAELYRQALDAEKRQDWKTAVQAYRGLLKVAPELPELLNNLGIALHNQGSYRESSEWLRKALEKKPEMTGARLFLGIDHYLLGQYRAAISELTIVTRQDPRNGAALLHLGAAQLATGAVSEAIESLENARRLNPDDVETLHTLAQAYMTRSKELFAQGRGLYERILQLDPDSPRTHQILAEAFLSQDQPEKAIRSYEKAIHLKPEDPGLHAALGETLFQLGKNADARSELEEATRLQPSHAKANLELAILDNLDRRFEDALARLDRISSQFAENPDFHLERAKAQAGLGKSAPAIESLLLALRLDPDNAQAHYQLAQLYRNTGNAELARQHLQEFSRLEKAAEARRQSDAEILLRERKP